MKNSITFDVEDVKPASTPLETAPFSSFASNFNPHVEASSHQNEELVDFGSHAFLNALHRAYAEHRPFVLSPDMIWLLIAQGFSQHVNANARELRHLFVDFEGKETLKYENDNIVLGDPNSPWELIFEGLTKETEKHCGKELSEIFTINFSTTTKIDRAVSQLTLLNTLSPYFEYEVGSVICGIPKITIEGTTNDWEGIISKSKKLRKYNLEWWIDSIIPVLEKIVETLKDETPDQLFWQHIFKIHSSTEYGTSESIDGWIVKFFPYYEKGYKCSLKSLSLNFAQTLPHQIHCVPFKFFYKNTSIYKKMEMIGGFIGASQNNKSLTIKPETGWIIGQEQERSNDSNFDSRYGELVFKNLIEFPEKVYDYKKIFHLELQFLNEIIVPDELLKLEIGLLKLSGNISKEKVKLLAKKFNNGVLIINGQDIYLEENDLEDIFINDSYRNDLIVVNSTNGKAIYELTKSHFENLTGEKAHFFVLKNEVDHQICIEFQGTISNENFILLFEEISRNIGPNKKCFGWFSANDETSNEVLKEVFDKYYDYYNSKTIMLKNNQKEEHLIGYTKEEEITFLPSGKHTVKPTSKNQYQPIPFDFITAEKVAEFKTKVS